MHLLTIGNNKEKCAPLPRWMVNDNDKMLLDASNITMAKYVQSVPTSVDKCTGVDIAVIVLPPLSNATQNVAVYMAGYLLLKVPVSDCDECSE